MSRVLTNKTGLAVTVETTLGTPGTTWYQVEYNTISDYGATIKTVARSPISQLRQQRKGTVVDLDSSVQFDTDLTGTAFQQFAAGFFFSSVVNADMNLTVTAATASTDDYTVAAVSASVAARLNYSASEFASLIVGRGFSNSANNGLKQINTDVSTSATAISTTASLVDETPPANARVELGGVRLLDAVTDIVVTYSAGNHTVTLTEQGGISGFDWADFGLSVGQFIHLGSLDASGALQNALHNSADNDTYGFGRVKTIGAQVLVLDKVSDTLKVATPTSQTNLDIIYGAFVRNVATSHADYTETSYQFELELPDLGGVGTDKYEYAKGNYCDAMSFKLPLSNKAEVTFGFIGTDTEPPTASRASGASSARAPLMTGSFNTSADIARLRIVDVDDAGLTTDFKELELTLGNNVSPEKVLGTLGAKYINAGNFIVGVKAKLIFSDSAVPTAIRNNQTVSMDFGLFNDDGGAFVDIPSMTLGDGKKEFPVNESVLINVNGDAFVDSILSTSASISFFPVRVQPVE